MEQVCWQLRLADWPRAQNRAMLNELYNGFPPYSGSEQRQNHNRIITNVNFLEGTKILHDARRQFATAFSGADQLFTVNVDYGPPWKRREWGAIITREMNKLVKDSRKYLNCRDSVFAGNVLHGIGPVKWADRHSWCPTAKGIEDILIPSNTTVDLENLPFFAVYEQYTAAQLAEAIAGSHVDPGWNVPLVKEAIGWVDQEAQALYGANWPEVWSPEKMAERVKENSGLYASDTVPTVDAFDFYFYHDDGKKTGWRRRIILDAWGAPGAGGLANIAPARLYGHGKGQFLYDSGKRIYADQIDEIIHFQFADASCVAPFRYHSVRSLGFLLYAVCHLQNRLRCKFNDAVFEAMLQYFRVSNPADAERLSKVDLIDKGVLPEGLNFVRPEERWQVDEKLATLGMELNRQTMADNSASFTQDFEFGEDKAGETATRTMAKVNATNALVGSMLNKSYNQEEFKYREMARRFCMANSKDADVRKFRVECLKAGVPREMLNAGRWNVQAVRVIGSGNKMLQVAMANALMKIRPLVDPEGQRTIDRIYVLANSDDPALVDQIVPESQHISPGVHDAQLAVGALMQGLPVAMVEGINHAEYIEALLHSMALVVKRIESASAGAPGMATQNEILGLQNLAAHIGQHIQKLAQDPAAKEKVKQYADDLGQMMNLVKAYAQRLQEQQQQAAQQNGGMDPAAKAKIQATLLLAQTKSKIAQESHAQKTAQRQIAFQQDLQQRHAEHARGVQHDALEHRANIAKLDMETAGNIRRGQAEHKAKMKAFQE